MHTVLGRWMVAFDFAAEADTLRNQMHRWYNLYIKGYTEKVANCNEKAGQYADKAVQYPEKAVKLP